ncbi:MAG: hypothetical protein ACK5LN_10610 [Propioniciclava sp.]
MFTTLVDTNPMCLVIQIAACLPYVIPFLAFSRGRFLPYARMRANTRSILWGHLMGCFIVTFATFAAIGAMPGVWMAFGSYVLEPEVYGLQGSADIAVAEQSAASFTQLFSVGAWAVPVAYGIWVGLNAGLHAVLSLCLFFIQRGRIVALAGPWVAVMLVVYAMTTMGWEAYAPALVPPFNVIQLPWFNFGAVLVGLLCVTIIMCGWILACARHLHALQ